MAQNSQTVRASAAYGPLLAAFRDAEARGLDIEADSSLAWWPAGPWPTLSTWPLYCTAGWIAGPRRPVGGTETDNLIAGLIPRIQRVSDPELAQALVERDQAMEGRARTLADQAVGPARVGYNVSGPRQLPRPGANAG